MLSITLALICVMISIFSEFNQSTEFSSNQVPKPNLNLLAKSMILIKSAVQYNNSTTDFIVALYGAHLHVITPRQHSNLRRC